MEKIISEEGYSQKTLRLLDDGQAVLIEEMRDYVVETPVYRWNIFLSKREMLNLYQALGEAINPQERGRVTRTQHINEVNALRSQNKLQ